MIQVKIDSKATRKHIEKLRGKMSSSKQLMNRIGKEEVKVVQRRIRVTKRDPDGNKWAPLSDATNYQRISQGYKPNDALYRSGMLLKSIIYKITGRRITIGTDVPYAKAHNDGLGNLPKRTFIGWGKESIKQVDKLWTKYLKKR